MASSPLRRPQSAKSDPARPGFFGKLPMRGDFVAKRIDGRLRAAFDEWLSEAVTVSRRALAEGWAEAYENAPAWRFVLAGGVVGPEPVAGVLMPSIDNHGRHFPLVIAVDLPGCTAPLRLIRSADAWFAAAERAALSALAEGATLDAFDGRVLALGQPDPGSDRGAAAVRFPLGDARAAALAYAGALEATLATGAAGVSVWWTTGGGGLEPSLLHHRGLPAPDRFAAMLDGRWEAWGWTLDRPSAGDADGPAGSGEGGFPLRSAARSHRGTRAADNQDAALERPDVGLWAVADGAGGHDAGAYASAVVIAKLAALQPPMSFASALTELEELLGEANDALQGRGRQLGPERLCAAVVVVLFVHKNRYAVIWAGDSRAYLHRNGRLLRLTRDHVTEGGRYVTRAIGAEAALRVDVARGEVLDRDRFVLCSDGLVKTVSDTMLEAAVRRGTAADVAAELIDDALIAGAGDNVTALVVDVADGAR